MVKSPIELAIPVFYLAILVEAALLARRRDGTVSLGETLANLAVGTGNFVVDAFWVLLHYRVYSLAHEHALWQIPTHRLWSWVLLFFLDDLVFYGYHRASHRVRVLWASHVVHHSSEEYSFSTATRQTWTGGAFVWLFWAPLALLGFHPFAILVLQALSLLYQFFLHTRLVGKRRPWLEWVLNTPSHHRAHHGRNPEYIDKNYGGVLIVWDRLFGTFEPEIAPVDYGITTPLRSRNPFVIALHEWVAVGRDVLRSRSVRELAGRVLGGPEWTPGPRATPAPVVRTARPGVPRGPRLALAALVLAAIPLAWAHAAEAYMQDAIAAELVSEVEGIAGFAGVLEERGVLPLASGTAVSRVVFRAPDELRVEALEPGSARGDVLSVSSGTLVLYARRTDSAVRVAHVPLPDAPGRARLARELVRARVASYAYEALPPQRVAGLEAVPWRETPRRPGAFASEGRAWLALGLAWPVRVELASPTGGPRYEAAFREARFGPVAASEAGFELPATATVQEWDLADRPLAPDAARAAADFPLLEPHDAPLGLTRTRIVRARAHWPPMLALVHERGPFVATVTELADRGIVPPPARGWPVVLGASEARVSFFGGWTIVSFAREGVSCTVFTNVPEADALAFAASLAR